MDGQGTFRYNGGHKFKGKFINGH
jgi:hypothetical protein